MGINLGPFARIVGHNFRSSMVRIAAIRLYYSIVNMTAIGGDGRKFYCRAGYDYTLDASPSATYLQEYTLSTPMMIKSMAITKNVQLNGNVYLNSGPFFIPPPGNTAFQFKSSEKRVSLFPLASPYDLTTLPLTGQYTDEFYLPLIMRYVAASPDGLEFFSCFKGYGIYRLSLRNPWDFSYFAGENWNRTPYPFNIIAFKPDGKTMYGLELKVGEVVMHQYALAPWDIDTLSWVGSYSVHKGAGSPAGLFVSEDGRYAYAAVFGNGQLPPGEGYYKITDMIQLQIS
ncbi:MAG: hypothetical protein HQL07_13035 [Nitrospirae bacterium]|nr:hypothetical protein [Magnetococcales bacterium]